MLCGCLALLGGGIVDALSPSVRYLVDSLEVTCDVKRERIRWGDKRQTADHAAWRKARGEVEEEADVDVQRPQKRSSSSIAAQSPSIIPFSSTQLLVARGMGNCAGAQRVLSPGRSGKDRPDVRKVYLRERRRPRAAVKKCA